VTSNRYAALLVGASLAALLCVTSEGAARGRGHFGGGGHFEHAPLEGDFRTTLPERRIEDRAPYREEADHPAYGAAGERRDDAHRGQNGRRQLASNDPRHPFGNGHSYRNQFWGDQFAARDFHCRNDCAWGWVGPVFWPFALGDTFSFAWWPDEGDPAFWDYGLNFILTGLFWPNGVYKWPQGYAAYPWPGDGSSYQIAREAHQTVTSGGPANAPPPSASDSATDATQTCSGLGPGVASLPMERIAQVVKPEVSQAAVFDALKAASAQAQAILAAACPSQPPLTPVGRLDAAQKRLEAMDQAVDTVMAPFAAFSKALTNAQRQALDSLASKNAGAGGSVLEMGDVGGCIDEGQEFIDLPAQEIVQAVQPDARQTAALDQLKTVSAQAAERLRSGCLGSVPATPEARMEAMDQRLHQTLVAVNDVRPALVGFYDSLGDEQKARFNTLPSEQAAK